MRPWVRGENWGRHRLFSEKNSLTKIKLKIKKKKLGKEHEAVKMAGDEELK